MKRSLMLLLLFFAPLVGAAAPHPPPGVCRQVLREKYRPAFDSLRRQRADTRQAFLQELRDCNHGITTTTTTLGGTR